jgi:hypothetical protein
MGTGLEVEDEKQDDDKHAWEGGKLVHKCRDIRPQQR